MKINQHTRDQQKQIKGGHEATRGTQAAASTLGVVMLHGGNHPATKSKLSTQAARDRKKRERQARKRAR